MARRTVLQWEKEKWVTNQGGKIKGYFITGKQIKETLNEKK
jgi:hypothetical protein